MTWVCSVPGCPKTNRATSQYCWSHYRRVLRSGTTELGNEPAPAIQAIKWVEDHLDYAETGCLVWPFVRGKDGYAIFWSKRKMVRVGRYICEKVNGPAGSPGVHVKYTCGNGVHGCVNPRHIIWNKGVLPGWLGSIRVLDVEKVSELRRLRRAGWTYTSLAKRYGVSEDTILDAALGKTWKHVPNPVPRTR